MSTEKEKLSPFPFRKMETSKRELEKRREEKRGFIKD